MATIYTREQILGKIKALLALSKSPNEHEAALALNKARQLLVKYNLELDEILEAARESQTVNPEVEVTLMEYPVKRGARWQIQVATAIAKTNLCDILTSYDGKAVYVIGRPANLGMVEEMFDWIMRELDLSASLRTMGKPIPLSEKMRFRHGWLSGATDRICERVWADYNAAKKAATSTMALVIRTDVENRGFLDREFPARGFKKHHWSSVDPDAYAAGRKAAETMSITPTRKRLHQ